MSNIFKAMKAKKKRAVDPNAPPRPNLMTHEVKLKEQKQDFQTLVNIVKQQEEKIQRLESKLNYQTNYLQTLHHKILNNK